MAIKLGQKVKDKITGFTGTVMSKTEYLYGCIRYGVLPDAMKDGKPQEWEYFDEQRLADVDEVKPGGVQPDPPQR